MAVSFNDSDLWVPFNSVVNESPTSIVQVGFSIRSVIDVFNPNVARQKVISELAQIHKTPLLRTISYLDISYDNRGVDITKVRSLTKPQIASIIYNKLRSLQPQLCNGCDSRFSISLSDTSTRKYCITCASPSHNCSSILESKIKHYLCDYCAEFFACDLSYCLSSASVFKTSPSITPSVIETSQKECQIPRDVPLSVEGPNPVGLKGENNKIISLSVSIPPTLPPSPPPPTTALNEEKKSCATMPLTTSSVASPDYSPSPSPLLLTLLPHFLLFPLLILPLHLMLSHLFQPLVLRMVQLLLLL